jgi:hypothetical protein
MAPFVIANVNLDCGGGNWCLMVGWELPGGGSQGYQRGLVDDLSWRIREDYGVEGQ